LVEDDATAATEFDNSSVPAVVDDDDTDVDDNDDVFDEVAVVLSTLFGSVGVDDDGIGNCNNVALLLCKLLLLLYELLYGLFDPLFAPILLESAAGDIPQ